MEVFGREPNLEDPLGKDPWKRSAPPAPASPAMSHGEAITMMVMCLLVTWALQQAIQRREKAIQKSVHIDPLSPGIGMNSVGLQDPTRARPLLAIAGAAPAMAPGQS